MIMINEVQNNQYIFSAQIAGNLCLGTFTFKITYLTRIVINLIMPVKLESYKKSDGNVSDKTNLEAMKGRFWFN